MNVVTMFPRHLIQEEIRYYFLKQLTQYSKELSVIFEVPQGELI